MRKEAIYSLIEEAIRNISTPKKPCEMVFLGSEEWMALCALCLKWGVDWPPGAESYSPHGNESMRAEFLGTKIYRVDAETLLVAA